MLDNLDWEWKYLGWVHFYEAASRCIAGVLSILFILRSEGYTHRGRIAVLAPTYSTNELSSP